MEKPNMKQILDVVRKEARNTWIRPTGSEKRKLFIYNSLTKSKEEFVSKGRVVKWYSCGPTVYDASHMGHGRNYVHIDMNRRILEGYFGYDVIFVQNVTDIDDKIIERVRREYVKRGDREEERGFEIFRSFGEHWEKEFNRNMRELNVMEADITTRVSEYIPNIIKFVNKLVNNGYGYEDNGSVYFDTIEFENKGHVYSKCRGVVGEVIGEGYKKSKRDFALWKKSKDGEPGWESPWGFGRPGWHIECSAMASEVLGEEIDIHSGGIDLEFPHHDNEIAQSEGFFESKQWVNYIMHTGHLHIEGQKMSKSLKNFITIDEALKKYTARELRIAFGMISWNKSMDFKDSIMEEARAYDKTMTIFFSRVRAAKGSTFTENEKNLLNELCALQDDIDICFCDNFNVPGVLRAIAQLVNKTNYYMDSADNKYALNTVARYISKIFSILGFKMDHIGWQHNIPHNNDYLNLLIKTRDQLRSLSNPQLFKLTDTIRDDLKALGVILDDRKSGAAFRFAD